MGAVLLFPSRGMTYKYRATKRGFASALLAEPARLVAASASTVLRDTLCLFAVSYTHLTLPTNREE